MLILYPSKFPQYMSKVTKYNVFCMKNNRKQIWIMITYYQFPVPAPLKHCLFF